MVFRETSKNVHKFTNSRKKYDFLVAFQTEPGCFYIIVLVYF